MPKIAACAVFIVTESVQSRWQWQQTSTLVQTPAAAHCPYILLHPLPASWHLIIMCLTCSYWKKRRAGWERAKYYIDPNEITFDPQEEAKLSNVSYQAYPLKVIIQAAPRCTVSSYK